MALSRRTGQRFQASIWPGFVDAMTGLLLVLMFTLTIFMVVQYVLRETITGQETQLDTLSGEVQALADALGLERRRAADLTTRVGELDATLTAAQANVDRQSALIASLTTERDKTRTDLDAAQNRITAFEAQVAALISDRDGARAMVADLQGETSRLLSEQEALGLALATARSEVDAQLENARLAAAKREAMEALIAGLNTEKEQANTRIGILEQALSEEERGKLAEAAAAQALRDRLQSADAELTATTLALETQRKKAEDTLTLLAAADRVRSDLTARLAAALSDGEASAAELDRLRRSMSQGAQSEAELQKSLAEALAAKALAATEIAQTLSESERRAALLATAKTELKTAQEQTAEAVKQQALLNRQVAALRGQLGQLQALLDDYKVRAAADNVQLQTLGSDLNAALARVASEERQRRVLEEAERKRLETEKQDLEKYKSEFFGRLREVLATQEGVRVVGDRFVFSSEVLFGQGRADLSPEGEGEIAKIADILRDIMGEIPAGIDWVIRVDGHTDNVPLSGLGEFADNWELSQARALSVVRYMVDYLGLPPERLSANGFGQYQPVNPADTAAARAQNRRIELKLTER
ncbi:MAG: peptidoglycan -binding protein [Paracoccaceae bacterium]